MSSLKSPMVQQGGTDEADNYSDLRVLRSAAGYYVGTVYTDPETGFTEPGSRDSGYFPEREEAEYFLDSLTEENVGSKLRLTP